MTTEEMKVVIEKLQKDDYSACSIIRNCISSATAWSNSISSGRLIPSIYARLPDVVGCV